MVILIFRYKDLLHRLGNAQNVQFLADVLKNAGGHIDNVPALVLVAQALRKRHNQLNDFFRQNSKMFETKVVVHADSNRDFLTRSAAAKVKYFYTYAATPEEKEEARRLDFIFDTYKQAERKDYKAETVLLRRLIASLREWPDLLVKYDLKDIIDKLEIENDDFENSYDERSRAKQLIRLKGDMKKLRVHANKAFSNLCDAVTGLLLTPLDADIRTGLENIVLVINRHIGEYAAIHHRHTGNSANDSGKNGDGEDEDNGSGEQDFE